MPGLESSLSCSVGRVCKLVEVWRRGWVAGVVVESGTALTDSLIGDVSLSPSENPFGFND